MISLVSFRILLSNGVNQIQRILTQSGYLFG